MPPPSLDPDELIPDPATLPRGLIRPPQEVLDHMAREKARLAGYWTPGFEALTLNDLTLAWFFEHQTVAYRATPEGPEVLAVGGEEIGNYLRNTPPEQRADVVICEP